MGYTCMQNNVANGQFSWCAGHSCMQSNTGFGVTCAGHTCMQANTGNFSGCLGYDCLNTNTFNHCYTVGTGPTSCTATNQFRVGTPSNPLNLFNANGYACIGCSTIPTNTAPGTISSSYSAPASQSFGAITVNAVFGLLTFTDITNAARTCVTATVTNSKVATSSSVGVRLEGWSGTRYTNGIPVVGRLDTVASSSGSFVMQVCNDDPTNALSGTFYIRFSVFG
jgi:hypothetical protein